MAGRTENLTVSFDRGGAKAMERLARAIEQSNQIEIDKERYRRAKDDETFEEATDVNSNYTVIGPECFTDGKVISYQGENYYKACVAFVCDREDGGQSFCVLRVGHPGNYHEAYDGTLRGERL